MAFLDNLGQMNRTTLCVYLVLEIIIVICCVICLIETSPSKMKEGKDLYAILGVPSTATDKEIKRAYRKMAIKYHPDKVKPEEAKEAEAKFILINRAYEILGDKQKRAHYDKFGENAFDGTGQSRHSEEDFPFEGFSQGGDFGGFNFKHSDFFDDFFNAHMRSHNEAHRGASGDPHFDAFSGFSFGGDMFFDSDDDDDDDFNGPGSFFSFEQSSGGGQRCRTETVVRGNSKTVTTICS